MEAPADFIDSDSAEFQIFLDASSIELFADSGANAITAQFFPKKPYTQFSITTEDEVKNLKITPIPSIWKDNN